MSDRLPIPVRRVLREPIEESRAEALWRHRELERSRISIKGERSRRLAGLAIAAAAVLGVLAALLLGVRLAPAGPLTLADGSAPGSFAGDARVELSDGSRMWLSNARLEVLENDGTAFGLVLGEGTASFDVRPGGPRRWTIACGLASVTVVGTRFRIERSSDRLSVAVEHGAVLVSGERVVDGARRLEAGESIEIAAPRPPPDEDVAPPRPVSIPSPETSSAEHARIARPAPPLERPERRARGEWRAMAERGAYADAYAALGAGGIDRAIPGASAEELLALADVARLSGHPIEAVAPLELLLREHRGDASAALAAFTLGRVEADAMHRPARAASAFEDAIALGIPRALLADALARLALAREASGDREGAREVAARYLAQAPEGPHAAAMRALEGMQEAAAE